jgi:hypothetical protein
VINRHIWQDYLDEVGHLRHTRENREIYAKRKETIERVFADLKEKHGMRWTTLKGKGQKHNAGDACFCCHEFEKDGHLEMENLRFPLFFLPFLSKNPFWTYGPKEVCLRSEMDINYPFQG